MWNKSAKRRKTVHNEIPWAVRAEVAEKRSGQTLSASDLIRLAKDKPPKPIIKGLLYERDIMLLHGSEESYKSILIIQIAESIASGHRLLRKWDVPRSYRVGVIETEMHPAMLGERLNTMYSDGNVPEKMLFMPEETLKLWRRERLEGKIKIIGKWIDEEKIDVLMIDTANDFFRGDANPSDERHVGELFDRLRNMSLKGTILVRHDHKKRELDGEVHSNELIRGSAEWKEDPEVILHIARKDKRTNQSQLEVGKLRYGTKPDPFTVWFDAGCFRLTPLPPVIALLEDGEKTRPELIQEADARFGISERLMAGMIEAVGECLQMGSKGHVKTYQIDLERLVGAEWASYLVPPGR